MLSASDFVSLVRCRHRVYLDRYGDGTARLSSSSFLQMLWESGQAHEDSIVTTLGAVSTPGGSTVEERVTATRALMHAGAERIYHGLLRTDTMLGEPDILERTGQRSALGEFAYVPVEIKNGQAFEDKKGEKPKTHYLAQLCAYADLLEHFQGWRPKAGKIIDSEGVTQLLNLEDFWPKYSEMKVVLEDISGRQESTEPGWKGELSHRLLNLAE